MVHEARGNRRYMPGLFSEQKPLGFPCHVVSPDQPLGYESFACVASDMTLSEFGAARVDNATLLMAVRFTEQVFEIFFPFFFRPCRSICGDWQHCRWFMVFLPWNLQQFPHRTMLTGPWLLQITRHLKHIKKGQVKSIEISKSPKVFKKSA